MENSKTNKIKIGQRYYFYSNENELKIIRIVKTKGSNVVVKNESEGKEESIPITDLESYIKVAPDAIYVFNLIQSTPKKKDKDILFYVMRKEDYKADPPSPYIICRQMGMASGNEMGVALGGCVVDPINNKETFEYYSRFHKILQTSIVCTYVDDTIDSIVEFIPTAVKNKMESTMKSNSEVFKKNMKNMSIVYVPEDIKRLIEGCMYYIDTSMKIVSDICLSDENPFSKQEILLGYKMEDIDVIKYNKDIDLEKLTNSEWFLMRNTEDGIVYLVSYIKGNPIKIPKDDPLVSDIYKAFNA